jgi:alkylation response protein AidB-like acyl-CoA dehydrogenase
MRLSVDTTLLNTAQQLVPLIREHADEAERERRLSRPVVDALTEAGLLRMYVPRSLGGLETDPVTCTRVVEEVSAADSAAGWMLVISGGCWYFARLPAEGAEEIYGEPSAVRIAGVFHPPMRAARVDGGYRVSGRSPLGSGIHEADWFVALALVMDGDRPSLADGAPEVVAAILRAAECEIVDTWHALGMRGTDSNDVVARDVFVPTRRTFPVVQEFEPGPHFTSPLYRMPAFGAVGVPQAAIALATARAAIDELRALALRKTPFVSSVPLRERASAQAKVGLAEAMLRSARGLLYDTLTEAWERTLAGEPHTLEQEADQLMASVYATQASAQVVELMYGAAGVSAIYACSRLERLVRDALVLKQHGFQSEGRYETVGQVYLGLPPDLALVAF